MLKAQAESNKVEETYTTGTWLQGMKHHYIVCLLCSAITIQAPLTAGIK